MKRFIGFSVALGLVFALNGIANATDFNVDGKVDVITALSVAETAELHFGTVTDNDGTITLNLADTISSDPAGISLGGSVLSGIYTITGEAGYVVSVVLTGTAASGLTIGTFTTSETNLALVSLPAAITIGANLTVLASAAAPGLNQSLNFTIAVTYN